MSQKIFDNDLVALRKNKFAWTLNKPPCVRICILYLNKVLMYEFLYDYIKNNMVVTEHWHCLIDIVWCVELRPKMFMKVLVRIKKCWILVTRFKYYDDSNKLIVGKMNDETGGVATKDFFGKQWT